MKKNPIIEVQKIKEIVDFLNSEFQGLFYGMLPLDEQNENLRIWHIVCGDFETYMHDQEYHLSQEAVQKKYPKLKLFYCYCSLQPDKKSARNSPRWKNEQLLFIK